MPVTSSEVGLPRKGCTPLWWCLSAREAAKQGLVAAKSGGTGDLIQICALTSLKAGAKFVGSHL